MFLQNKTIDSLDPLKGGCLRAFSPSEDAQSTGGMTDMGLIRQDAIGGQETVSFAKQGVHGETAKNWLDCSYSAASLTLLDHTAMTSFKYHAKLD